MLLAYRIKSIKKKKKIMAYFFQALLLFSKEVCMLKSEWSFMMIIANIDPCEGNRKSKGKVQFVIALNQHTNLINSDYFFRNEMLDSALE